MTTVRINMGALLEALQLEDAPHGLNNTTLLRLPLLLGGGETARAVRKALKFGAFKVMRRGGQA